MPLEFKRVYLWHMDRNKWEKAMDAYEMVSMSFRNVHQRFLDKAKSRIANGFGNKQNKKHN